MIRHFVSQNLQSSCVRLGKRSANYLGRTLRLKAGASVVLFNGEGLERLATITELRRHHVTLALGEHQQPLAHSPLSITLIQGLAKGGAMDWIVQKATELGITQIWPVTTAYGVVRLNADRAARRLDHWQSIANSACEQSGRHRPTTIMPVQTLQQVLDTLPEEGLKIALQPGCDKSLATLKKTRTDSVTVLVGPEGGLDDSDMALAGPAGFQCRHLGPRILRVETAAITACVLLQAAAGDLASSG